MIDASNFCGSIRPERPLGAAYIDELVHARDHSNGHADGIGFCERPFDNSMMSPDDPSGTTYTVTSVEMLLVVPLL